jgi:ribose-phosphate pyrophosphokinase
MSSFAIIGGDAHPQLARQLAQETGAPMVPATLARFADGETRVRIEGDVSGADLYLVQPTSPPVNEHLMGLALLADAARAAGAARITAVVSYFGYARQDARKAPGEPRSAQLACRLLECAGVQRFVALELHSPALDSAFRVPLTHLEADASALPAIRAWGLEMPAIVAPDAGGLKRAQRYAAALRAPLAVVTKTRTGADASAALAVLGEVRGRNCVIVDDLVSTGGTLAGAAKALREAGAASVHAFFVHAVMAPEALERLAAAGVQRLATTDSVAFAPRAGLEIISVAPLLGEAIRKLRSGAAPSPS